MSNLVTRDPAVEVRRGAVSLITLLLRGLDTEALQVFFISIMGNTYQYLFVLIRDIILY